MLTGEEATATSTSTSEARNKENVEVARGLIGNAAGAGSTLGLAYLGTRALQRRVEFAKVRACDAESIICIALSFSARVYL